MNDNEQSSILAEIVALSEPYAKIRNDEITLQTYAQEVKLSPNAARARLDKLVEEGILQTRLARVENHTMRVYGKAGE